MLVMVTYRNGSRVGGRRMEARPTIHLMNAAFFQADSQGDPGAWVLGGGGGLSFDAVPPQRRAFGWGKPKEVGNTHRMALTEAFPDCK